MKTDEAGKRGKEREGAGQQDCPEPVPGTQEEQKMKKIFSIILALVLVLSAVSTAQAEAEGPAEARGRKTPAPQRIVIKGLHDVGRGLSIRLKAAVKPSGASQKVTWKSSDPSVATVSSKGKVTGLEAGEATITVTSKADKSIRETWQITVHPAATEAITVTAVSRTIWLKSEDTRVLQAEARPEGALQRFTWKSSNRDVAEVSGDGVVRARKAGKATITVSAADGSGKKASIRITVKNKKAPAFQEKKETRYYALLIQNGDYRHISKVLDAKYDVQAMKNMLKGLSQPWTVRVKKNLTSGQILSAIRSAFKGATEDDVCLFYYAGHGNEDTEEAYAGALVGVGYNARGLTLGDAEAGSGSAGMDELSARRLAYALDQNCPGKVIVILECCGSGSYVYDGESPLSWQGSGEAFNRAVADAFGDRQFSALPRTGDLRGAKFTVMTTCEHGDWGKEIPLSGKVHCGALTYSLVKAMGCGFPDGGYTGKTPADLNGDGAVTLEEAFAKAAEIYEAELKSLSDEITQVFQRFGDGKTVLFRR